MRYRRELIALKRNHMKYEARPDTMAIAPLLVTFIQCSQAFLARTRNPHREV